VFSKRDGRNGDIWGGAKMIINRKWNMPSKNTFSIKPIKELVLKHSFGVIVDPFSNNSKIGTVRNDLNPSYDTHYHLDALEFLKLIETESADVVLFDPPYSNYQAKTIYDNFGGNKLMRGFKSMLYWKFIKDEIKRVLKPSGKVITCGWSSNGLGIKRGFEIIEILMVAHGGNKNDTIVVVETKRVLKQV
jgi:hypothetical protein